MKKLEFSLEDFEALSKSEQRKINASGSSGAYCINGCCSPFCDGWAAFAARCL